MEISILSMSFTVGILIGLTSMGGAALMAPFLILVVGIRPVIAVQTDLIYGAITKAVGAWMHWRQGSVDLPVVKKLAMGSIPGGLLGCLLVGTMPRFGLDVDRYVQRAIGIALVVVATVLVWRMFGTPKALKPGPWRQFLQTQGTVIWGALVGFCVGLTSVGSGSLIAPFLMLLLPFSPAKVVGTDVFHAALLVSATGLAQAAGGNVNWPLVGLLLAGSIPGVLLGSRLAPKLPPKTLRAGLAVLLLVTGIRMV